MPASWWTPRRRGIRFGSLGFRHSCGSGWRRWTRCWPSIGIWRGCIGALIAKMRLTSIWKETVADLTHLGALLQSPGRCRFVPVMLAEALSIHVTRAMLTELERLGLPVREVVVNRLLPVQPNCPACAEWTLRQAVAIEELTRVFSRYTFWGLPLFLEEVRGTERLLTVWEHARPLAQAKCRARNDER